MQHPQHSPRPRASQAERPDLSLEHRNVSDRQQAPQHLARLAERARATRFAARTDAYLAAAALDAPAALELVRVDA